MTTQVLEKEEVFNPADFPRPENKLWSVDENRGLHLYPHPGQLRTLDSTARFPLMLAGTQGGKTTFGPPWLNQEMRTAFEKLRPGEPLGDFAAVSSSFDLLKLKMLPELLWLFDEEFSEPEQGRPNLEFGHYWAEDKVLEIAENFQPGAFWSGWGGNNAKSSKPMWGRIILRSAESPSGLESMTAKAAWLDEVGQKKFTITAWEAVNRRLSQFMGRALGTTTVYSSGWLKRLWHDKARKEHDPDYQVVQFDSTMNPSFPEEEFERARRTWPLWKFNMFYRGMFDTPAGLVYRSFNTDICVINRFDIPEGWLWYVGHDFGSANPAALVYAQNPSNGLIFLVYNYKGGSTPVNAQVRHLQNLTAGRNVIFRMGGSHQEQDSRENYTKEGWPIAEPEVLEVQAGLLAVNQLHADNKIFVFSDLDGYLDEKGSYSYELTDEYDPTDNIVDKSSYHYMDAERYLLPAIGGGTTGGDVANQLHTMGRMRRAA